MFEFPPNSHDVTFWNRFSNDPDIFRAQVIVGIYYEISIPATKVAVCANEVALTRLVQNSYGKWRFNPTFVEESLGPVLTQAMRDYHLEIQREREETDNDRRVFEEQLRTGPPNPPVGDYFWYELRGCFRLNDTHRFRLWARSLGYFPRD